mmetsp:Transcript_23920/g.42654  ORF Transcript_23920/g.42654 Transcript_23920/m.42654 type:complete len:275 (+) Transcript_23920:785-1609(+)
MTTTWKMKSRLMTPKSIDDSEVNPEKLHMRLRMLGRRMRKILRIKPGTTDCNNVEMTALETNRRSAFTLARRGTSTNACMAVTGIIKKTSMKAKKAQTNAPRTPLSHPRSIRFSQTTSAPSGASRTIHVSSTCLHRDFDADALDTLELNVTNADAAAACLARACAFSISSTSHFILFVQNSTASTLTGFMPYFSIPQLPYMGGTTVTNTRGMRLRMRSRYVTLSKCRSRFPRKLSYSATRGCNSERSGARFTPATRVLPITRTNSRRTSPSTSP